MSAGIQLKQIIEIVNDEGALRLSAEEKVQLLDNVAEADRLIFCKILLELLSKEKAKQESTKGAIEQLESHLRELTEVPYRLASFLQFHASMPGKALVKLEAEIFVVRLDRDLDMQDLKMGDGVFLSAQENVIMQRAPDVPLTGNAMKVQRVLAGNRALVSSESGEETVVFCGGCLGEIEEGDVVLLNLHGFVTDRLSRAEVDGVKSLQAEPNTQPITFAGYHKISAETRTFKNIFRFPQLAAQYRLDHGNHLLLAGPPGTGKTLFARNLAFELGAELFVVNGSSLLDKYIGNTEKNIRELFERVAEHSPAILLLDEVDALAQKRGRDLQGHHDRFLNVLLGEINGALESPRFSVLVTTNRQDMLDPAFVKRLRIINFSMPGRVALREIIQVHLASVSFLDDLPLADLTDRLLNFITCPNSDNSLVRVGFRDGTSRIIEARELIAGREIEKLVQSASSKAFNRTVAGESVPITVKDFEIAIEDQFNIWRESLNKNNISDYIYDFPADVQIASVEPVKPESGVTYLYPEVRDAG